jgi:hypothetical protein
MKNESLDLKLVKPMKVKVYCRDPFSKDPTNVELGLCLTKPVGLYLAKSG